MKCPEEMEPDHLEEVAEEEWADRTLQVPVAAVSVRNVVTVCLTSSDSRVTTLSVLSAARR